MKKEELLPLIQALPDGIDVVVLDPKKNLASEDADNVCREGIYSQFTVTIDEMVKGTDETVIEQVAVIEIPTLTEDESEEDKIATARASADTIQEISETMSNNTLLQQPLKSEKQDRFEKDIDKVSDDYEKIKDALNLLNGFTMKLETRQLQIDGMEALRRLRDTTCVLLRDIHEVD